MRPTHGVNSHPLRLVPFSGILVVANLPIKRAIRHIPTRRSSRMDLDILTQWTHDLLSWVGFGTIVGLLAKAILPGKDPGGALATVCIGVMGSIIGAALVVFFAGQRVSP